MAEVRMKINDKQFQVLDNANREVGKFMSILNSSIIVLVLGQYDDATFKDLDPKTKELILEIPDETTKTEPSEAPILPNKVES